MFSTFIIIKQSCDHYNLFGSLEYFANILFSNYCITIIIDDFDKLDQ